jgi:hypothetical protein
MKSIIVHIEVSVLYYFLRFIFTSALVLIFVLFAETLALVTLVLLLDFGLNISVIHFHFVGRRLSHFFFNFLLLFGFILFFVAIRLIILLLFIGVFRHRELHLLLFRLILVFICRVNLSWFLKSFFLFVFLRHFLVLVVRTFRLVSIINLIK